MKERCNSKHSAVRATRLLLLTLLLFLIFHDILSVLEGLDHFVESVSDVIALFGGALDVLLFVERGVIGEGFFERFLHRLWLIHITFAPNKEDGDRQISIV